MTFIQFLLNRVLVQFLSFLSGREGLSIVACAVPILFVGAFLQNERLCYCGRFFPLFCRQITECMRSGHNVCVVETTKLQD